jgi:putative transposase
MRVFGLEWQFETVAKHLPLDLPAKARDRLRALHLWQATGDPRLVGRTFQVSRATLYRWRRAFNPADPRSLGEQSRRPRRVRAPQWSASLVAAVRRLREQYPRWGRAKLTVLLHREGFATSASTVGRILRDLRRRGRLHEPPRRPVSATRRRPPRPYAVRKPREYAPARPGDLVQLDTLDLRPVPGVSLKQFTARDLVSRWDVLEVRERATAGTAADFLLTVRHRMPFPVRAIQVDGGSEFYAVFEEACRRAGIQLFVLPPKSPKLNGAVERAQRTHTEEFYEVHPLAWNVATLNRQVRAWERVYNTIRPHQALGQQTPLQFLQARGILPAAPPPSHMS